VKNDHLNFRYKKVYYISYKNNILFIFYQFLSLDRQGNPVYLEIKKNHVPALKIRIAMLRLL